MPTWASGNDNKSGLYWPWPHVQGFAKVFGTVAGILIGGGLAIILLSRIG